MAYPDLPAEQAYVDHARAFLDSMREALLRTANAGATEVAAEAIEAWAIRRLETFADSERGLCFGRLGLEGGDRPIYVGRRWVSDQGDRGTLVVNWQAPAARPFYTATPAEPHGITLRRRFRTRGRELLGLTDEALDGSLADAASATSRKQWGRFRTFAGKNCFPTFQAGAARRSRSFATPTESPTRSWR